MAALQGFLNEVFVASFGEQRSLVLANQVDRLEQVHESDSFPAGLAQRTSDSSSRATKATTSSATRSAARWGAIGAMGITVTGTTSTGLDLQQEISTA